MKKIFPKKIRKVYRILEKSYNSIANYSKIKKMEDLLKNRPLLLRIETTNFCNSKCVFCAYNKMSRKKTVMPLDKFEKLLKEYSKIGGGAISLTPIMGDPLLDPFFIKRIQLIKKYGNINQISFSTNGIALKKYSEKELKYLIRNMFLIRFSVGEPKEYSNLYGVDEIDNVLSSISRVLKYRKDINNNLHIYITFRAKDDKFKERYSKEIKDYKKQGVFVSCISNYHNYGGYVKDKKEVNVTKESLLSKSDTCAMIKFFMQAASNSEITNCCMDINAEELKIGNSEKSSINEIWKGQERKNLLTSFPTKIPGLCRECSFYKSYILMFSEKAFKEIKSYNQLPLKFYLDFFGG